MEIKAKNQISIVDVSDGKSVSSIVPEYYLSTSNIELSGGSWSTEIPARTKDTYIWTRSRVEFSNPTETAYTTAVLDNATNNMVAVGSVTETLNAELDIEGNTLIAKAGKLIIQSPQLSLDEEGNLIINTKGLSVDSEGNAVYEGSVRSNDVIVDEGVKIRLPWNIDGSITTWQYYNVLRISGTAEDPVLHFGGIGMDDIIKYEAGTLTYNPVDGQTYQGRVYAKQVFDIANLISDNTYAKEIRTGPDPLNPIDMSSYTETNITNRSIIASGSGNIITHKRYNSVTVTCTVSSVLYELATSAGYVSIGTLPTDCIPTYKIIEYHRFSALYFGQIQITTDGKISIGYVKKNDGSAVNLPANSGMYWAFTYTI